MPDPATLILKGRRSLVVTRDFDAPRDVVWAAFTDPNILRHWLLGPPGWSMHQCEVDLSIGGSYAWRWRLTDTGEEFGFTGIFSELEPGVSFADAQTFDNGGTGAPIGMMTRNFVSFSDNSTGTRVSTTIRYPNAPTRFIVMEQGMGAGMELSYARLDAVLASANLMALSA